MNTTKDLLKKLRKRLESKDEFEKPCKERSRGCCKCIAFEALATLEEFINYKE